MTLGLSPHSLSITLVLLSTAFSSIGGGVVYLDSVPSPWMGALICYKNIIKGEG